MLLQYLKINVRHNSNYLQSYLVLKLVDYFNVIDEKLQHR